VIKSSREENTNVSSTLNSDSQLNNWTKFQLCLNINCNQSHILQFSKSLSQCEQRSSSNAIRRVVWMRGRVEIRQISRMARVFWHRAHIVWHSRCIFSLYALAAAKSAVSECILCAGSYLPDNMFALKRGFQTDLSYTRICARFCHLWVIRGQILRSRQSKRWLRIFFTLEILRNCIVLRSLFNRNKSFANRSNLRTLILPLQYLFSICAARFSLYSHIVNKSCAMRLI